MSVQKTTGTWPLITIEFDALDAYPVDELVYLRVAPPKEFIAETMR
jgi:hypothetical protein